MNEKKSKPFGWVVLVLMVVIASSSYYIVDERQQAVVLQFGKIQQVQTTPGLKFKIPLIQQVTMLEKRVLAWDGQPGDMTTGDKKRVWIDTSARWAIVDPELFLISVGNEQAAQSRLDDVLDSEVRKAVAKHRVSDLVRGSNRELTYLNEEEDMRTELENHAQLLQNETGMEFGDGGLMQGMFGGTANLREGYAVEQKNLAALSGSKEKIPEPLVVSAGGKRGKIMEEVTKTVDKFTRKNFGIQILDVRIKRLTYADSVQEKIYEKMVSERKAISEKYRSTGQGFADKITGGKERKLKEILSGAQRQAEIIKGDGDAQAAKIYNDAYGQDQEFYVLVKKLETYKKAVDAETQLILPLDSDTWHFLKDSP